MLTQEKKQKLVLVGLEKDCSGSSLFLSYSRKDKAFAKQLWDGLRDDEPDRAFWVRSFALFISDSALVSALIQLLSSPLRAQVDWEDTPPSNDWLDEICAFVACALPWVW
jgi:hypothetical protein